MLPNVMVLARYLFLRVRVNEIKVNTKATTAYIIYDRCISLTILLGMNGLFHS